MQLLCNGERLDLAVDTGLQLKKTNILFAFDNIECERSASFEVPATPRNDRIFSLAKWEQTSGTGMRRRYDAQMQAGMVTKNGYLYVGSYSNGRYKVVFVTGELIGLQTIRDAGKVQDIIGDPMLFAYWTTYNQYTPLGSFDVARYGQMHGGYRYVPSVTLKYLIETAMFGIGETCPPISDAYRVILKEPNLASGGLNYEDAPNQSWSTNYDSSNVLNTIELIDSGSAGAIFLRTTWKIRYRATNVPNYMYGLLSQLRCGTQDITLSFPDDFSADYFILSFPKNAAQDPADDPVEYKDEGLYELPCTIGIFLGDYSFSIDWTNNTKTAVGEPLAGRTVTIPRGTPFIILDWADFILSSSAVGWYTPYGSNFTMYLEEDKAEPETRIPLFGNMPDVTLTELLKAYATMSGKVLYYDETNGVQFDSLAINNWDAIDVTKKVISKENLTRTFGDYAQLNRITFEGDDTQIAGDKIILSYQIDNDNIEQSKELQRIPFSEGSKIEGSDALLIRNTADQLAPSEFTIGATHGDKLLHRVGLQRVAGLVALLNASTSMTVRVRMSLLEFDQMQPKKAIFMDGVRYVWTEANWGNNVATIKIAKIPV